MRINVVDDVPPGIIIGDLVRALPDTAQATDAFVVIPRHPVFRVAMKEIALLGRSHPQMISLAGLAIVFYGQNSLLNFRPVWGVSRERPLNCPVGDGRKGHEFPVGNFFKIGQRN